MSGRHIILDETIPGDEIDGMIGRVVLDIKSPLRRYAPDKPRSPKDIIPSILPAPVMTTNQKHFLQNHISRDFQSGLSTFFGLDLAVSNEERFSLESAILKRYTLEQVKSVFDELMKDVIYRRNVEDLFKNNKVDKAYLVTGFLTTDGGTWIRGSARGGTTGVKFTVPLSAAITGAPSAYDPHFGLTSEKKIDRENEYITDTTEIFAVAYDVVRLKRTLDRKAPGFLRTRNDIILGSAFIVNGKHLAMGQDEDEIIEEEEDGTLILDDQVDQIFELLVGEELVLEEPDDSSKLQYFDVLDHRM